MQQESGKEEREMVSQVGDLRLTNPILQPSSDASCADILQDIDKLSPTTQNCVGLLIKSITNKTAELDVDAQGHITVGYKKARKIWWDATRANIIDVPKSDADAEIKVDACLELIDYVKTEKLPSGVVLDGTKIHVSEKGYREGFEFIKTKQVLGSGNCAGDIIVVKDRKSNTEHAQKTLMISYFRREEIRCWVDLSESGYVPSLYLFKIENNKVTIHMEILEDAITLRSIIDDHLGRIYTEDDSLMKPFSLYVLNGALDVVTAMHSKGWLHKDLHAGNVMLQKKSSTSLKVKVIDFGLATRLSTDVSGLDVRGFRADIGQVVRLFSSLYCGEEFNSVLDVQKNWECKLGHLLDASGPLSESDRDELFCLIDGALKIVHPDDVPDYKYKVKGYLYKAMGDTTTNDDIMKRVISILFPDRFGSPDEQSPVPMSPVIETDGPVRATNVADSKISKFYDTGNGHRPSNNENGDHLDSNLAKQTDLEMDEVLKELRFSINIQPSLPDQ